MNWGLSVGPLGAQGQPSTVQLRAGGPWDPTLGRKRCGEQRRPKAEAARQGLWQGWESLGGPTGASGELGGGSGEAEGGSGEAEGGSGEAGWRGL